jgi:hypothetical protein
MSAAYIMSTDSSPKALGTIATGAPRRTGVRGGSSFLSPEMGRRRWAIHASTSGMPKGRRPPGGRSAVVARWRTCLRQSSWGRDDKSAGPSRPSPSFRPFGSHAFNVANVSTNLMQPATCSRSTEQRALNSVIRKSRGAGRAAAAPEHAPATIASSSASETGMRDHTPPVAGVSDPAPNTPNRFARPSSKDARASPTSSLPTVAGSSLAR